MVGRHRTTTHERKARQAHQSIRLGTAGRNAEKSGRTRQEEGRGEGNGATGAGEDYTEKGNSKRPRRQTGREGKESKRHAATKGEAKTQHNT